LTLVEVLFSLLILATAVLSVVLLFPAGVRTLEQSRFQTYAALKAMEITDFVAQSRKNWLENDLEIDDGLKVGGGIRLGTNAFTARHMPDIEQMLLREMGTAYPMPPQIARRLDSPGDMIGRVIADGGILFYADPMASRDGSRQAARFGNLGAAVPELQKMVFALVTPPQQNLVPNHPSVSWPFYELYPFPPQARLRLPQWQYTIQTGPYTEPATGTTYAWRWDGPVKSSGLTGQLYQGETWEWMAANAPGSLWAASGVLDRFRELCEFGYTPVWFKISYESGTVAYDPHSSLTGITNPDHGSFPPKPGGPSHWRGERIQEDVPGYFAAVPAAVETARVAMNIQFPLTPYVFDQERTMRLPSLGMRRMYRQLALELWNSLEAVNPTGKNPLVDDLTTEPIEDIHPARVLALSYLSHAAMMVTGYRLPYINTRNDMNPSNDVDLNLPGAGADHATYVGQGMNQFAANDAEANPDGSIKADATPTADEDMWAQRAHENMLNWAMRFASNFPNDLTVPRPANRPMSMDRPAFLFDLFDGAGNARRNPSAVVTWTDPNPNNRGWPRADRASVNESFYQLLSAVDGSGGSAYPGFEGKMSGWSGNDDVVGDLNRHPNWRAGFDAQRSPNNGRYWADQPFAASERARVLVFWAVDWKSYVDAETAPSAPMDAGLWYDRVGVQYRNSLLPEDHPEAPLLWSTSARNSKNGGDSDSQSFTVFRSSVWNGQFGADRNVNGVLDRGSVMPEVRLRASEVARFIVYDSISYQALRR